MSFGTSAFRARRRARRDLSPRASSADTHHDVVVVGNGPIGSAVARHCSSLGASVLVLDGRDALTSASDDMGRIVRPLDAEGRETWTRLNVRSIEAFPELESESGIAFFRRCGSVACGTPAFVEKPAARLTEAGIGFDELGDGALVERAFPYLSVPSAHVAIADRVGGFVDPKKMIEAQNALTLRANPEENRILLANATEILERGGGGGDADADDPVVVTEEGTTHSGVVVVVAGGAYTPWLAAKSGLVAIAPPSSGAMNEETSGAKTARGVSPAAVSGVGSVRASRRTVVLAEVTETTATGALKDMPTLKYQFKPRETTVDGSDGSNSHSRNEATSVYVLPPIRYPGPDPPEGWYVKIGGGANDFFERERWESTVPDLERWMRSDGDEKVADVLVEILTDLMPRTNFLTLIPKACVTTCTDDGELQCDALGREGRILGVSGCQGKAAGPADAIGEAVAREVFEAAMRAKLPGEVQSVAEEAYDALAEVDANALERGDVRAFVDLKRHVMWARACAMETDDPPSVEFLRALGETLEEILEGGVARAAEGFDAGDAAKGTGGVYDALETLATRLEESNAWLHAPMPKWGELPDWGEDLKPKLVERLGEDLVPVLKGDL